MRGKIFVHVGLPKTATTTLQLDFFSVIAGNGIHYIGVRQPRLASQQDRLYLEICDVVNGILPVKAVRETLKGRLDSGETVVISDESFTVSRTGISWRGKMRNLAELLCGLDYVLIITVREPAAALFSYYVELHKHFSRQKKSFLELAKTDEGMQIFHYQKLTDEILRHFDRECIFVKKFEDIINGQIEDLCRLVTTGRCDWHSSALKKHNEKRQTGNVVYTGKKFTLADIVKPLTSSLGINEKDFFIKMKKSLRPVLSTMDSVVFFKKSVAKPSIEEIEQLKTYLKAETAALGRHFGVKYE